MTTRVALVTGGSRGIGRAIAQALGREGLAVAVAARGLDGAEKTVAEVRAAGGTALAVALDVAEAASVDAGLAQATATLGPIDVLVNNAGVAESAPFAKTTPEMWERHFRVNVDGPYRLTRAVLDGMLARGWGRVINVASLAGLVGSPYVTAYTASKHALVGLTRALAAEVSGKGVTVNALCPGFAATDIVWNGARNIAAKTGRSFEDAVASLARLNPGGRLIEPEEVAAAALRLLHDDTTNGEAIILDGTTPLRRGRGEPSEGAPPQQAGRGEPSEGAPPQKAGRGEPSEGAPPQKTGRGEPSEGAPPQRRPS